mmetsp:Transcript_31603/g.52787  ORF Transcript_31603/g.52787 Transcript_31603/m.52787 type:complete len:337 (+) Transcript_31603:49-1059(+)
MVKMINVPVYKTNRLNLGRYMSHKIHKMIERPVNAFDARKVKVISLDVTGTILVHKNAVQETYADAMKWANLPFQPSAADLAKPFKKCYRKHVELYPSFGYDNQMSSRRWWKGMVKDTIDLANVDDIPISEVEFNRFFRRVFQHYGSPEGYECLPDAQEFLEWAFNYDPLRSQTNNAHQHVRRYHHHAKYYSLGILTNTTERTVETVLPMLGLHNYFDWFVCCRDIGYEKPDVHIFDAALNRAQYWAVEETSYSNSRCFEDAVDETPKALKREEILHIGDNFAAGFQALFLDRSGNKKVTAYQDWLTAPDYPGKCEEDVQQCTVQSLKDVKELLLQ